MDAIPIRISTRHTVVALLAITTAGASSAHADLPCQYEPARVLPDAAGTASAGLTRQLNRRELLNPIGHELWLARIDEAALAVHETKGSVLIDIARLGKGEHDRRLSRLRLKYMAEILDGRQFHFRLIVAEGDRVPELGRIEFYVCNELYSVLPYERGKAVAIQHRP